jgi:hypothetical protein
MVGGGTVRAKGADPGGTTRACKSEAVPYTQPMGERTTCWHPNCLGLCERRRSGGGWVLPPAEHCRQWLSSHAEFDSLIEAAALRPS